MMLSKETKDKLDQTVSVLCDSIITAVKTMDIIPEDHIKALEAILPNIDPVTEPAPAIGFATNVSVNSEIDIDDIEDVVSKISDRLKEQICSNKVMC